MNRPVSIILACTIVLVAIPFQSQSEVDLRWGGRLQTDLRFLVNSQSIGEWYAQKTLLAGVSRNENIFKLKLDATAGNFTGVVDIDFVWLGYSSEVDTLGDLFKREKLDPFRLEAHAAYVEAVDLFVDGLDLRVGQQVVAWGVGDQFNPTNTINALDLEDPLLFGEQLANAMVRVDYNPIDNWRFSAVLVPIFKPALLPKSAELGAAALDRQPFVDSALRQRIHSEQAAALMLGYPAVAKSITPVLPQVSFENMQYAFRAAGVVADQDIALSYYNGRTDIPQAWANYSQMVNNEMCNVVDGSQECIKGVTQVEAFLGYPRMQVVGFNMDGQVPLDWMWKKLRALGYRLELGVFFPQESSITLLQDAFDFGFVNMPAGEYDYGLPKGEKPLTVQSTPFAKWVLGLDYTFNRHLYVNAQWVHGFPDEYGAGDFFHEGWSVVKGGVSTNVSETLGCIIFDSEKGKKCTHELLRPRLGDYLVLGMDIKFLSEQALLRLFFIFDLTGIYEEKWDATEQKRIRTHHSMFSPDGFSAVVFPEFTYNFGHGFELSTGALLKLGKTNTKFGDPAAGGSEIWTRARFSY